MSNLSNATVGTKLYIPNTYVGFIIETVTRITATSVCCGNTRIRKDTGLVIGSSSGLTKRYARIATDSDVLKYRIASATSKLAGMRVTPENIDMIETLLRS